MIPRGLRPALALAALLATASVTAYLVMARSQPDLWAMIDLDVYRWGGSAAFRRRDLYNGVHQGLSFTYPPFAAAAFAPFAAIPMATARWVITLTSIASLFAAIYLTLRAASHGTRLARLTATMAIGAAAMWFEPVQQTLGYGQINLVLMAMLLADLLQHDDRRLKGIGVGIAAGLKLTPAIFVVYLVVTGRIRAAVVAATTAVGTVLVSFVFLPEASHDFWIGARFLDTGRVGNGGFVANQSINGVIVRAMGSGGLATVLWLVAATAIVLSGLRAAAAVQRRGIELEGVLLCALVGLLVSPISWSHHWVWVVPAWAYALAIALRHRTRTTVAAVMLVPILIGAWAFHDEQTGGLRPLGLIWLAPETDGVRWAAWQSTLGALYVILGMATLLFVSWGARALADRERAAKRPSSVDVQRTLANTQLR